MKKTHFKAVKLVAINSKLVLLKFKPKYRKKKKKSLLWCMKGLQIILKSNFGLISIPIMSLLHHTHRTHHFLQNLNLEKQNSSINFFLFLPTHKYSEIWCDVFTFFSMKNQILNQCDCWFITTKKIFVGTS